MCMVDTGSTLKKKERLRAAGFKWNPQQKIWWKYTDMAQAFIQFQTDEESLYTEAALFFEEFDIENQGDKLLELIKKGFAQRTARTRALTLGDRSRHIGMSDIGAYLTYPLWNLMCIDKGSIKFTRKTVRLVKQETADEILQPQEQTEPGED